MAIRCLPLTFEFALVVLAFYKATNLWREGGKFRRLELVKVLVQDQILYFVTCVSCLLTYAVVLTAVG